MYRFLSKISWREAEINMFPTLLRIKSEWHQPDIQTKDTDSVQKKSSLLSVCLFLFPSHQHSEEFLSSEGHFGEN